MPEHLAGAVGLFVSCALSVGLIGLFDTGLRSGAWPIALTQVSVEALRTYEPGNVVLIACGPVPVPGWEGCTGARGITYEGSDGSTLVLIEYECTSARAARDRLEQLVHPGPGLSSNGKVAGVQEVDAGLLIEFGTPVETGLESHLRHPVRCAVGRIHASGLKMVHGPDVERTLQLARQLGWDSSSSLAMAPN